MLKLDSTASGLLTCEEFFHTTVFFLIESESNSFTATSLFRLVSTCANHLCSCDCIQGWTTSGENFAEDCNIDIHTSKPYWEPPKLLQITIFHHQSGANSKNSNMSCLPKIQYKTPHKFSEINLSILEASLSGPHVPKVLPLEGSSL